MALPLEDYALIGDTRTAALVGRDGSIDWLCLPRFDSASCFAALLGKPRHGRWRLAPHDAAARARRAYSDDTLVLETEFATATGTAQVRDCMPLADERSDVVRLVRGITGRVAMRSELVIRFDYGTVVPWVRKSDGGIVAVGGPDAVVLRTGVPTRGEDFTTVADFEIGAGQEVPFVLSYFPSHRAPPPPIDANAACAATARAWREWIARCRYRGEYDAAVRRSLLTLKALTYAPSGGIVAAASCSLPEQFGGERNWDYRYCWLRDAAFTLDALLLAGFTDEARAWRDWLLRAAAGRPQDLQIMYGLHGERRLTEFELPWLPGYEGAAPVRVGNAASRQFQLDVYGEVMNAMAIAHREGIAIAREEWQLQRALMDFLESAWTRPDHGIWEMRTEPRHFTHSKLMCWVAFDRAVRTVERSGIEGPAERWRALRAALAAEIVARGFDTERNAFTQSYGSRELDASLLRMPLVGFLPATDPRVQGTVAAIERELIDGGLVCRYRAHPEADGLPPGEGVFLPCSFWLLDNYALQGRRAEARALFERLLGLANDVGLLSEEYDPRARRLAGNFPQAFSHVALINAARCLPAA